MRALFPLLSISMGIVFFYNACGNSSSNSGSGTTPVSGIDMSGVYEFANVSCDNGTSITQQGNYGSEYFSTWVISGNSVTNNTSQGGCISTATGTFVFNSNNTLNMTGTQWTSATGGACQMTLALNNSNITPTSLSVTPTKGQSLPDKIGVGYAYSPTTKLLALTAVYSASGTPCFEMYQKQ